MPGELSNCIAGRVANLFNLHGPNFTVDAACASAMAAMDAAIEGLTRARVRRGDRRRRRPQHGRLDLREVLRDRRAVADRHAPVRRRCRRLRDGRGRRAVRAQAPRRRRARRRPHLRRRARHRRRQRRQGQGHHRAQPGRPAARRRARLAQRGPVARRVHDGRGPRDVDARRRRRRGRQPRRGLRRRAACARARSRSARSSPTSATSRRAAGAAGILKTALALHDKVLPPSLNFERPNPNVDWAPSPFAVNTELRAWEVAGRRRARRRRQRLRLRRHQLPRRHGGARARTPDDQRPSHLDRRAGRCVGAARGAGPGRAHPARAARAAAPAGRSRRCAARSSSAPTTRRRWPTSCAPRWPRRARAATSTRRRRAPRRCARPSGSPSTTPTARSSWPRPRSALRALQAGNPAAWTALRGRGIYRGSGAPGKVAFLYTGQGSQYANMLAELRRREPVVAEVFDEADAIMAPLLEGRRLSDDHLRRPGRRRAPSRVPRRSCAAPRSRSRRC